MSRLLCVLMCATVLSAPALAASTTSSLDPEPSKSDPRMRTAAYNPQKPLRLYSTNLTPVRVLYHDGEIPVSITGAQVQLDQKAAKDWYALSSEKVRENALLLQPLHEMPEASILFVTTQDQAGKQRHYVYELHTRDGDIGDPKDKDAYMQVSYIYPEDIAAAQAAQAAKWAEIQQRQRVATSLTQARFSAPRNYDYWKQDAACALFAPANRNWVSDDGVQTTLLLAPHAVAAEIYEKNPLREGESLITTQPMSTPEGSVIILPKTYKEIRLRSSGRVCAILNRAYQEIGTEPGHGSGTLSPEVIRTVKQ